MESYLALMIPILGISLGFFGVWTQHQQKMIKLRIQELTASKGAAGQSQEQTREVEELRERVKVLERIVTDGGYDLATQIEALRNDRPVPAAVDTREAERLS